MSLKGVSADDELLDQLAGITGIGWTTSILGFLSTVIGYGTTVVANPATFLYIGTAFFLATLGLDRLRKRRLDGERTEPEVE